jgi:predicted DNA-binding transcriptional regulator AlpA
MASAVQFEKAHRAQRVSLRADVPSPLLTAEDVAALTGLSVETLAQWRSQRKGIPYVKISRNCVRYRQSDIDAWLAERIVPVENDPSIAGRRL